ncbi:replicative DNA helicase [Sphingobacterium multivorum]|uniref:replicative DNA helicase n=1 Tax=Sphingobacterium multivorum TaxID=28454 RepID=UPI0028AA446E|nr:replicative DNA helicase [Sphingobacterium multivorum]
MKSKIEGKLPPQAVDLEEAILGACISETNAFMFIADILRPEMFYRESHQIIFKACQEISVSGSPLDLMTLMAKLRKDGNFERVGGIYFLTGLTDRVVSSVNMEYHSRIIAQKFMQRELIKVSHDTIDKCYDETNDIFDILSSYETKRDDLVNHVTTKKEVKQADALEELFSEMIRKADLGIQDVTGVNTGFQNINEATGGWQCSDLIIIAARPAMGKTAFVLKQAVNAAKSGKPVAIFSLEMSKSQLLERMISFETEIDLTKIKKLNLADHEWHKLHSRKDQLKSLPIHWDDTPGLTLVELSAKAKRMKRLYGVEMIVIDYLQLISVPGKSRLDEISTISRGLKILAKELNIPVLALSQLSRAVESRPGNSKRPMLSDLRESGSIEQDADIVGFLYRPEYYGITEDEEGRSTAGIAEFIIAKNRNGSVTTCEMGFVGRTTNFKELEDDFQPSGMITDFSFVDKPDPLPSNDMSKYANWDSPMLPDDGPF